MNRKKKINETLKAKVKKRNAKLHKSNKPKYISKADRAKLAKDDKVIDVESAEDVSADASADSADHNNKPY